MPESDKGDVRMTVVVGLIMLIYEYAASKNISITQFERIVKDSKEKAWYLQEVIDDPILPLEPL